MKLVTLNVEDSKYEDFLDIIKSLDYVEVEYVDAIEELHNSLKQVKLMKEGKINKQTAIDFLNEL